jgi:hypothetical protein
MDAFAVLKFGGFGELLESNDDGGVGSRMVGGPVNSLNGDDVLLPTDNDDDVYLRQADAVDDI